MLNHRQKKASSIITILESVDRNLKPSNLHKPSGGFHLTRENLIFKSSDHLIRIPRVRAVKAAFCSQTAI